MLGANGLLTVISTASSIANYPGGDALNRFNGIFATQEHGERIHDCPAISDRQLTTTAHLEHVHISNLAAQTGASLFLQNHTPPYLMQLGVQPPKSQNWVYNKTENLTQRDITNTPHFTHVIAEAGDDAAGFTQSQWNVVENIQGFQRWIPNLEVLRGASIWELLKMEKKDKLVILKRK